MKPLSVISPLALAATLACAQPTQQVTVTGRIIGSALEVGGFGAAPLARSPFAASLLTDTQLLDAGARNVSDLTRLDAAISDAYNAEGYWQFLSVRGFVLDNRYNFRRDGLPINAETAIPLTNKSGIEVLKGTSGIQAGTSAPGGLANLLVKRPTGPVRSALLAWQESGNLLGALDWGQRFGRDDRFGLRVNASAERLDPKIRDAKGDRHLFALAGDFRPTRDSTLEAEFETSRQSQPSVPGFSLLGNVLPAADTIDPRINLNNQSWTLPVVFDADTASLRWRQAVAAGWTFTAHAMTQHLVNQDRIAFPFGCSAENVFDRYCSDGTFDYYDFRSDDERRRSDAAELSLVGKLRTGALEHSLQAGVLGTRYKARFHDYAYNFVGIGRIDGTAVVPPDPTLVYENTNRDERSTELYVRDVIDLTPRWSLWAGLRHSKLDRRSVGTAGSEPIDVTQSFTTPWLALAHRLTPQTMLYASWGEGVESDVAPNNPRFANAGQVLPALKSRQTELGLKHDGENFDVSAAAFDIDRPVADNFGACDVAGSCTRRTDGSARHRGVEGLFSWRTGAWRLHASAMWLDAKRRGSSDSSRNGLRPANVAERTLRLHAEYDVAALPGLAALASLVYEGDRVVLPYDTSVRIPAWTRLDLSARYAQRVGDALLTWRIGVDNVADRRAWKESPFQFGHAYLFPLPPRTWRVSLQADL